MKYYNELLNKKKELEKEFKETRHMIRAHAIQQELIVLNKKINKLKPITYGYARVSTTDQKLDRQLEEFKDYNIEKVFSDKLSGKNFERKEYQKLRKLLKKNDTLVISSIDRLGRNYDLITNEWRYLTNDVGVNIVVIDMPILNTKNDNDLTGKLISDIVLQLLSYVAQLEREKIKARQKKGIETAKKNGIHLGRPKMVLPDNFKEVVGDYELNIITLKQALELTGMKTSTFFKYKKEVIENESK